MSAITGIFMRNGNDVDPELMKKMNEKLSHRGPDGSAIWCEGPIGLGHQMMWTTQESLHEKLPFEEYGMVITADARIDNRDELSKELGLKDEEDVSDSYFILKAYQMWGEECPDKLLGDFAFAIWDKAQEKLFCARDHMGVKPFYYYLDDDMFVFGTEIKSILSIPEVPYELNDQKIAFFLMPFFDDRKLTFYKKISRLPSANLITVNNQKFVVKKYWELDHNLELKIDSDEEYVNKFLEIFMNCIKCRLRSQFPVGFELSGGMDSSSVVCTAKKVLKQNNQSSNINTFSKTYNDIPESDESYYINKVIDSGGIKPYILNMDQIPLLSRMDEIFSYYDEPFDSHLTAIHWNFNKKIQDNHIKVLLTGLGGDTTLYMGGSYLKELAISFKWIKLYKEIKGYSTRIEKKYYELILYQIIFPLTPQFIKKIYTSIKNKEKRQSFSLINKKLVEKLNLEKSDVTINRQKSSAKNGSKKFHYLNLSSAGHQSFLEATNHRSAAFSIEYRYPYYDKRLIEFCYSIPTEQKFRDGWDRIILRRAMKNILPPEIQWRPSKVNFNPVIEKNLLLFEEEFKSGMENELLKDFVDTKYIHKMSKRKKNKRYPSDITDIMRILILKSWLEKIKD